MATTRARRPRGTGRIYTPKTSAYLWIQYYGTDGKRHRESTGSTRQKDAERLLKLRHGDIEKGLPVSPRTGRTTISEALDDVVNDYTVNERKSTDEAERRITKHLKPHFVGTWRLSNLTTADVNAYTAKRLKDTITIRKARVRIEDDGTKVEIPAVTKPVSVAEVNRELSLLRRAVSLAYQAGKILHKPHVPLLTERNTRTGFFEPEQLTAVLSRLPEYLQPGIEFAAITGWRVDSEVWPLQWRQVDFDAGEIRLDAHTTKSGAPRIFPMTSALRSLLKAQWTAHDALKKKGLICPYVFFRMVAEERGGEKKPKQIVRFDKSWRKACIAAGQPGKLVHDLRRTAARALSRAGVSERVIMDMCGWKSRSVFDRYRVVGGTDLKDAARRLDAQPTAVAAAR